MLAGLHFEFALQRRSFTPPPAPSPRGEGRRMKKLPHHQRFFSATLSVVENASAMMKGTQIGR